MATKKKTEPIASSEIKLEAQAGTLPSYADSFIDKLDHSKIQKLEKEVSNLKEKNSKKVYAVKLSESLLHTLIDFIQNHAEWTQTEALGIIEIHKTLLEIQKEGVKDNTVFLNALPLEATHYFLSKRKGTGLSEAKIFISLYKPFTNALDEIKKDAAEIQALEKELSAAQQGIEAI
jgi:hypothetical protein